MKRVVRFMLVQVLALTTVWAVAQNKIDEDRMTRDIEVAENVLSTLVKQKFDKKGGYYGFEVEGKYMPGYGVTFRVPGDSYSPLVMSIGAANTAVVVGTGGTPGATYSYSRSSSDDREAPRTDKPRKRMDRDSAMMIYNERVIEAAKEFLADYADLIGQLTPEERVVVTNRGGGENSSWYYVSGSNSRRTLLSIEASKSDISQFRQAKMSREQFMAKVKVVNTKSVEDLDPDLEVFSTMINRLYRPDLSKTYFTQENVYYERLKDFGVIYYMTVYSSQPDDFKRHSIPTLKLDDVDQATRDKKVKELYPAFEKDIRENMLEYGRTLRSLKDNENLVMNVRLTKCEGCGIPATLEMSLPATTLKDYNTGKVTKDAALAKINMKKGANQ